MTQGKREIEDLVAKVKKVKCDDSLKQLMMMFQSVELIPELLCLAMPLFYTEVNT